MKCTARLGVDAAHIGRTGRRFAGLRRSMRRVCAAFVVGALICLTATPVLAAEGGKGFYLLGFRSNFAGILPPPGWYFQSDTYFLQGDAGAGVEIPDVGELLLDAQAKAALELATFLWSTPVTVLGGNLGLSLTIPFGYQEVTAGVQLAGPRGGVIGAARSDRTFDAGDPVPAIAVGWHGGNWHGTITGQVNVPIGSYDESRLANIGFNRWAGDITGAVSWFNPLNGLEASAAAGFTFNGLNPATDYRTGTEFHLEAAASKTFANGVGLGVAGYYYNQITDDEGRIVGPGGFRGEVAAIGPTASHTFEAAGRQITARARYYHEFAVENRVTSDTGYLTIAIPLQRTPTPPAMEEPVIQK
jgi:hypothetical protein